LVRRASASNPNAFARVGVAAGLVPAPNRREERPQGPRLRRRRENRQSRKRESRLAPHLPRLDARLRGHDERDCLGCGREPAL